MGLSGVFAGAVGALLAFSGFEAAAPLAEETKNPRRNIPLAIMGATVAIGALYIFTTYAADVSFGPGSSSPGSPRRQRRALGRPGARTCRLCSGLLVLFAIVNSTLANANSGANVFTRTAYAMGRIGVFPRVCRQPASQVQVAAGRHPGRTRPGLRPGVWSSDSRTTPVTSPSASSRPALVVIVVPVYMIANLACIGFFARHRKEEQHWSRTS